MKRFTVTILALVLVLMSVISGCSTSGNLSNSSDSATTSRSRIDTLRLVGTIGPLSIPLAYLAEHNNLASVAKKTTLSIWANPTQLQAIISGAQGDFVSLPTNSAATFYNKGVSLKLLDSSIWNILYLVSPDTSIKNINDLKGKRIVVPYQGAIPDAMFQFICRTQGLDPKTDLDIYYAPDPIQASQLLLSGQEKYVLLSEPSATSVIQKGKSNGTNLARILNVKTEWEKATGGKLSTPVAGTIVLGNLKNRTDVVNAFKTEYQKAILWMLANPAEAGETGARALTEQGFSAAVLTESLKNIEWRYVSALEARSNLENFLDDLMQISPDFTGGKIPDNDFYFGQQ
jgi:NitT/TauT family transport system substrate-binding protein